MSDQKLNLLTRVIESAIADKFTNVEVVQVTESVVSTRRYIGVKFVHDTEILEYLVQIDEVF